MTQTRSSRRPFQSRALLILASATLVAGCGRRASVAVHIRAGLDSLGPLAGLRIVALPYDPNALRDSLAAAAPQPRPTFPDLTAQMDTFHPAGPVDLGTIGRRWGATRDSVLRLADSLQRGDRRAPGYGTAYARFRALYHRLSDLTAERDRATRALTGSQRALAERAGRAADSLRSWEERAYASYPKLARERVEAAGRPIMEVWTDSAGSAVLELSPGAWWLVARIPYQNNPFLEYRWNVPLVVHQFPVAIPITGLNATTGWRH